jgi:LysM repeat protein
VGRGGLVGVASRAAVARVAAPIAFFLAATVFVLLVRSGLRADGAPVDNGKGGVVAVTTGQQQARVRGGDTLERIAKRYGTSVPELRRLNPGIDAVGLRVGQTIRVK